MTALQYALTGAIYSNEHDMPLTGRGLKHLIHRKRSPFSFSGDVNPFVLADISPNRGITQGGRQGVGVALTTFVVCGQGVEGSGSSSRNAWV